MPASIGGHGGFLDTNVLVYLAVADPAKAERTEQLLAEGPAVSVQVLNELANVLRRKASFGWAELRGFLTAVRALVQVTPVTEETHDLGLQIAERYGLATYDALILAAALLAGCEVLWSEDLQDGLIVEGRLQVRNPFRSGVQEA